MNHWDMRVYHKSCESMEEIPDKSVHCCVTSPPYFGLRDYGVDGQIGLENTIDEYVKRLVVVFEEVRRVLRDDGSLWLNIGDSYAGSYAAEGRANNVNDTSTLSAPNSHRAMLQQCPSGHKRKTKNTAAFRAAGLKPKDLMGIPWRVAFALQASGWFLRDAIIWEKPNPMPQSCTDRCTSAYEMIFMLTKNAQYFADMESVRERLAETSALRLAQNGIDNQHGSLRANGMTRTNRPMKATCRQNAVTPANPEAHEGLQQRWGWTERAAIGANARNVWTIATRPYTGAHFATMPPDLPAKCIRIGTSEAGCCARCGAPRTRQISVDYDRQGRSTNGPRSIENRDFSPGFEQRLVRATTTTGFIPSCGCKAQSAPSIVLDPFMGSGTVAEVAEALGRRWVGYEISGEYHKLIAQRTSQQGLFIS